MSTDWTYLISLAMMLLYICMIIASFALIYVGLGILTANHEQKIEAVPDPQVAGVSPGN